MADTGGRANLGDRWDAVDSVTESARKSWWDRQDSEHTLAWIMPAGVGAVWVLAVPLLSIVLPTGAIPAVEHFARRSGSQ